MEVSQLLTNPADVVSIFFIDVLIALFCFLVYFLLLKRLKIFNNLPTARKSLSELLFSHTEKHYEQHLIEFGPTV